METSSHHPDAAQPSGSAEVNLTRYAWLSVATGVVVFGLKLAAWGMTGSVGLLSDAMESTVNIVAAVIAVIALKAAARPPDQKHHFGRSKAEYFSAFAEGAMIFAAALLIIVTAVDRLAHPQPLNSLGLALAVSVVASGLNGAVAFVLIRAGRQHRSLVLTADGTHLLTDVWTSAGVIAAIGLVALTGWEWLDPIIAIAVAINIVIVGWGLLRSSTSGLLDRSLSDAEHDVIVAIVSRHESDSVQVHALQTRESGRERFVSMHVLVPGQWNVQQGHDLLEVIEHEIRDALPGTTVQTHLEPLEDPRSWDDIPPGQVERPGRG